MENFIVREAEEPDGRYAGQISTETELSAIARGSGIAKRSPESIIKKMVSGTAVIALTGDGEWAGYAYLEVWSNGEFVSNSGLIVAPKFRNLGLARRIKEKIVELAQKKYPEASIFSITTGLAIMKLNSALGFQPVTFGEITHDESFWLKCSSCTNFEILQSKKYKNCLCTAFLREPEKKPVAELQEF